ncbi:hypothetical protein [Cupriavidus basilensis]|uniref:hypothetical protein n=1 Tax=Cupriavidus basilensis TaxID=68895 RepID=UPI001146413F|nr:hypothetical protein [Cupriavidus basilensis]
MAINNTDQSDYETNVERKFETASAASGANTTARITRSGMMSPDAVRKRLQRLHVTLFVLEHVHEIRAATDEGGI